VRVQEFPAGGILCVRGQDSGPRRRRMPPAGRKSPRARGVSPTARTGAGRAAG